ncbi:MAG TPA: hypothetical protein VGK93_11565 [Candidatus Eisenbacteria bacterium]
MTSFTAQADSPFRAPAAPKANLVARTDNFLTGGYIEIVNTGSVAAVESHTRLSFRYVTGLTGSFDVHTAQIPAGEAWRLYVSNGGSPISMCVEADCGGEVDEDDDSDNEDCVRHIGS